MKTFGTQSCETELAKGPGTSYRIIKLTRVVIFFYLRRIKKKGRVGLEISIFLSSFCVTCITLFWVFYNVIDLLVYN